MPPEDRPRTIFAPVGDSNGFTLAFLASLPIGGAAVYLLTGELPPGRNCEGSCRLELYVPAVAISVLAAWLLYSVRWLRFTPERLLIVRPWLISRVEWESVRHCDLSGRHLSVWLEGDEDRSLLRARAETLLESSPSRSARRLALVLSELHGHRVPLAPDGLVWAVGGDDEDEDGDQDEDQDQEEEHEEADARAAARLGVQLSDTEEPGSFYRPVPIDSIPAVRALWQRLR